MFELCIELGYEHPDHLLDVLSASQISEWEAFNRIQPIGTRRLDYYFSYLMTSIHNIAIAMSGAKGAKQFELTDFLPNWAGIVEEKVTPEMNADQIKQFFVSFAETHNKKVAKSQNQQTTKRGKK